ncbi:MAG: hypothetical protein ACYC3R_06865, partial [Thiomonas delicata]
MDVSRGQKTTACGIACSIACAGLSRHIIRSRAAPFGARALAAQLGCGQRYKPIRCPIMHGVFGASQQIPYHRDNPNDLVIPAMKPIAPLMLVKPREIFIMGVTH